MTIETNSIHPSHKILKSAHGHHAIGIYEVHKEGIRETKYIQKTQNTTGFKVSIQIIFLETYFKKIAKNEIQTHITYIASTHEMKLSVQEIGNIISDIIIQVIRADTILFLYQNSLDKTSSNIVIDHKTVNAK